MNLFYSKIAGTTFDGRQDIIEELSDGGMLNTGQRLLLKREPENPYDSNAIAILHPETMQQLGYIEKTLASQMVAKMNFGTRYAAEVSMVTGGTGYQYGVNIILHENPEEYVSEEIGEKEVTEEHNIGGNNMYSRKIYTSVCEWMDASEFGYETDENEGTILLSGVKVDSAIGKINIFIRVRENDMIFYSSPVAFSIDSANIMRVGELCLRVNEQYLFPTFDIDFSDNSISAKTFFPCGDRCLEENDLGHKMAATALHFQKYGNALMSVALGFQTPVEALANVKED